MHLSIKNTLALLTTSLIFFSGQIIAKESLKAEKPNFVWLLSEDSGREHFSLYNSQGAITPNINKLAQEGLIFERALSNAPVCSVARSTLATGAYAPRIGVQYHRAWHYVNLPNTLIPISKLLMEAGYYTSNNYKTDYNFTGTADLWHANGKKATWQGRKKGQPFFHMQTWETTHSSRLHYPKTYITEKPTYHDPKNIIVAPYYPDTQTFRYTYARYLDKIKEMDLQLGVVVDELKQQGELDNTFIFFFGDHGGPLPGSKGYLFDRGLHIPLVVRVPKNFQHLLSDDMQQLRNFRIDGVVNFIDFAPTLAKLAGLPVSLEHDGQAFLGRHVSLSQLNNRSESYSYADRFDERSSLLRSYHKDNFQYIRRYEPFTPDSLFNAYRAKQPAYQEWANLYKTNKLNSIQASYFKLQPPEALYDLSNDPHQINNLAKNSSYQDQLKIMRSKLNAQIKALPDVGFLPESLVLTESKLAITRFGQQHKNQIAELVNIADFQLMPYLQNAEKLKKLITKGSAWKKYWALIVATHFAKEATDLVPAVTAILQTNEHVLVKARAIQFLATATTYQPELALIDLINQTKDLELVEVLNITAQLKDARGFVLNLSMPAYLRKRPAISTFPELIFQFKVALIYFIGATHAAQNT